MTGLDAGAYTEAGAPRSAYRTVLELTGHSLSDWPLICERLHDTLVAGCLSGRSPADIGW